MKASQNSRDMQEKKISLRLLAADTLIVPSKYQDLLYHLRNRSEYKMLVVPPFEINVIMMLGKLY